MELEPELVQEIGRRAKKAIRGRMRVLRQALPPSTRQARSELVCRNVLATPEYRSARGVALYAPLQSEVAVNLLDAESRALRQKVYYPFMEAGAGGYTTGFRELDSLAQLEQRGRKFLEPPPNLPMAKRGDIDLVVVPAVAVAANGHRLGYGSGFYDATLPDVCPPATLLAVVFDFQLLGELPVEEHDVPVHIIATDQRVLRAAGE